MSDTRNILEDAVNGLFAERVTQKLLQRAEDGEWPGELWSAVEAQGLGDVFAASDEPFRDAGLIIRLCGYHALPLPLPESLIARAVVSDATREKLSSIPVALAERVTIDSARAVFHAASFGRHCGAVVGVGGNELVLHTGKPAQVTHGVALSREPRDDICAGITSVMHGPARFDLVALGAMMRASQMAGAIARVLDLCVRYAGERVQFGKPLGSFQAIQQQLAVLASEAAAATRAADAAFEVADRGGDILIAAAIAKSRAGEAAGRAAAIAHQTHGAIGITDEHVLHHLTRRLWTWRAEWGNEAVWNARLGRYALEQGADGLWPALATQA